MASINTNLPALTAQRNLAATQSLFHRTVTRLSSGLRINSAADDAAGLFISEKLKNQVAGLKQASRNAQDGISMIQTADGGLSVHHDILLRLRELAVQSANGIMTDTDRQLTITPEAQALLSELTRISQSTQFNGMKMLDGTMGGAQVTGYAHQGAVSGSGLYGTQGTSAALMQVTATGYAVQQAAITGTNITGTSFTTTNGFEAIQASKASYTPTAYKVDVQALTTANTSDVTISQLAADGTTVTSSQTITASNVTNIKGGRLLHFDKLNIDIVVNNQLGSTAVNTNNGFAVSSNTGLLDQDSTTTGTLESTSALAAGLQGIVLQVGANNVSADQMTLLNMNDMSAEGLGLEGSVSGTSYSVANNLGTQSGAQDAIDIVDNAISQVSTLRSNLGAYQNRLDYTVTNLGVAAENQEAANSRIRDADVAQEVSNMVRTQILSQSAMAILAQANAAPQALLSLFR